MKISKQVLALALSYSLVHSTAASAWSAAFSPSALPSSGVQARPTPGGAVQVPPPSKPAPCPDIRLSGAQAAVSAAPPLSGSVPRETLGLRTESESAGWDRGDAPDPG